MPTSSTKPKNFTFYTVASGQSATLTGNGSTLYGGNDTLASTGKNNVLVAGSGSSTLISSSVPGSFTTLVGNGSSSLFGGTGNDYFSLSGTGDQISGISGGNDTVASSANSLSLQDTLTFGPGISSVANLIYTGNNGGATLNGNSLPGSLIGSRYYGNQIVAGTGAETLVGGSGNDSLVGNGRSVLIGNGGNDTYVINQSGDKILQTSLGGTVQTTLQKFDLSNTAQNGPGVAKVTGVVFSDNGTVTSGVVTLTGNSLNNTIVGAQNTSNYLTAGSPQLNASLQGGSSLVGGNLGDTLVGNNYSTLVGGGGTNTYYVSGGHVSNAVPPSPLSSTYQIDKIVDSGTGGSVIGLPQRTADFYYDLSWVASASASTLTPSLGGSPTIVPGNGHVTHLTYTGLTSGATLIGNTLTSNTVSDTIVGGSGPNTLIAGFAGSSLVGGVNGNLLIDSLSAAPVTMVGSSSNDTYVVGNSLDQITEQLPGSYGGMDQVTTDLTQFSLSAPNVGGGGSIEKLVYSPFGTLPSANVSLTGNTLGNIIDASRSTGATIDGGGGYDTLIGSTSGSNLFIVENPQNLGPSFLINGGNSGTSTLSLPTPINSLTDASFGGLGTNGIINYVSNVRNLALASSSAATLGVAAQTTGITRVYLGQGPDTLNMSGYGTLSLTTPTLDATADSSEADLLVGSSTLGSDFLFSSAQAIALSTIRGGAGSDTLAVVSPLTLNDSFQASDSGLDILSLASGTLGNAVTLGANSSGAGISTVIAGSGPDTVNASGYTSRGIVIDATADAASADILTGSATANSTFLFSSQAALSSSTIVGGSGRDTIAESAQLTAFSDAFASADSGLDVLSLGSAAGNSISLAANAQAAGISYVYTGSGADTVDASSYSTRAVTLDASADNVNPNFYLAGNPSLGSAFVISTPSLLAASTIVGGTGSDSLLVSANVASLADSVFGGSLSGVDVLSLQGSGSSVTLDSLAAVKGIGTVVGGAGSVSIYQNYNPSSSIGDTLPSYFAAGQGPALFGIGSQVVLANDTIVGSTSSLGSDTLQLSVPSQKPVYDSRFSHVSSVEVLKLTMPTTLTAGVNAVQAGISTISGSGSSLGGDIIDASAYTSPLTINLTSYTGNSIGDTLLTGSAGLTILIPKLAQLATNSIVGGTGSDTLVITQTVSGALADASFGSGLSGIDAISLSGSSTVTMGSLAAASGISAVYAASLGSTLAQTSLDANAVKLVGNAGNDSIFVSSPGQLLIDTVIGGAGINTLTVGVAGGSTLTNVLSDASFAKVTLTSGSLSSGVLSLAGNANATIAGPNSTTLTAGSSVTLGSFAAAAGITTVFGGDSNDTITQTPSDTLPLSLVGGNGTNLFVLNASQLGSDSLLGGTGAGRANIQLVSPATLGDAVFANDRALKALILSPSLSGNSSVTLGSSAASAGISSVVSGPNADTINAISDNQPVTLDARNVTTSTPFLLSGSGTAGSTFLLSGSSALGQETLKGGTGTDTLAFASSSTLADSLLGRISSMDVLSLTGSSSVTLGGSAFSAGIRRVVMSDSLQGSTVTGNSSVTQLGSDNQSLTLQGGVGNDLFSIANGALMGSDSIVGGGGTDSLQLGAYSVLPDSLFSKIQGIGVLQLARSSVIGGSSVTLGTSAGTAGFSTVVTGAGPDVINASSGNRGITFDARANTASALLLAAPSLGSAFLFGSTLGFSASTLRGNSLGIDTLQFTSPVTLSDSLFSHDTLLSVLQLTSSSSATLGSTATAAGIKSVVLGTGPDSVNAAGDSLPVTLDARLDTNTLVGDYLRGSSVTGSAFLLPNSSVLGISTITGGNGVDSLILSSSATLSDSLFANVKLQPTLPSTVGDILSLAGASAVTLDSYAVASGIKSVILGDSLVGSSLSYNSSLTQTANDTLPLTIVGGAGNDLINLANSSLLSGASTVPAESISGGGGSDTLALAAVSSLPDSLFARTSSIGTLLLAQGQITGSSVTLGSMAQSALIRNVVTGSGPDSVNAISLAVPVTLDARAASLSGDYLRGGSLTGSAFLFSTATAFSLSTVIGGAGTDTVAITSSATLGDTAFGNDGISSLDVLSLAGSSSVTLGTMGAPATPAAAAQLAGIKTVILTDSLAGDSTVYNSSFTQGSNDTLAVTAIGGAGNDLFRIASTSILTADSINGGSGINTLALGAAATLADANFSRITSLQALQLSTLGANSVTIASNAQLSGLSTIVAGPGADTISASVFVSSLVVDEQLNTGAAASIVGGANGNRFLFSAPAGLAAVATLRGGAGTDTIQFTSPAALGDSLFNHAASTEVLQLTDSTLSSSSVTLGSSAVTAGIKNIIAGAGSDTINASGDSLSMTLDARAFAGTLAGDSLLGSSITGSAFLLPNSIALGLSTITGGTGVDSLVLSSSATLSDSLFANVKLQPTLPSSIGDLLFLAGSSSVTLDSYAAASGIKAVILGDSLAGSTLTYNSTLTQTANDTLPMTLVAGAGNDFFSIANASLLSGSTTLPAESIRGGAGTDTLQIATASTIGDSLFARISSMSGGTLILSNGSTATLDSSAFQSGFRTVYLGDSLSGGSTLTQTTSDALPVTVIAGQGNDLISLGSTTILTNDSIKGGSGIDTLAIGSAGSLGDSLFGRVSSMNVLSLSGASAVTLGAAAQAAGISSVYGGAGGDTLVQTSASTSAMNLIGGATSGNLFVLSNTAQLSGDTLLGAFTTISGGGGTITLYGDTLSVASQNASITDGLLAHASNIGSLSLTGSSTAVLGAKAQAAGISTIYGGADTSLVSAAAMTSAMTINNSSDSNASSMFGGSNSDLVIGGTGNDTLQGWSTLADASTDTLTGGSYGANLFVLGNAQGAAYMNSGNSDFALITDFVQGRDSLQLHNFGNGASDYTVVQSAGQVGSQNYTTQLFSGQELIADLNVISGDPTMILANSRFI